jgi:hypothetical protein
VLNYIKVGRGIELQNEIPAQFVFVMIHDHGLDIIHIQSQGVTEHKNKEERDKKGQIETSEIPD